VKSSSSTTGVIIIGNATPSLSVGKVSVDNGNIMVPVTLARNGNVKVRLYSVLGSEVASVSELMKPGTNSVHFARKNVPPGVYMLSVQTASSRVTKRLDLSK
jgi:hypothetical protein